MTGAEPVTDQPAVRQGDLLWQPTAADSTALSRFLRSCAPDCGDSTALHSWSVNRPDRFWEAVWQFCGVVGDRGTGPAVTEGREMRDVRFFPGAALNYAENLLAGGSRPGAGAVALVCRTEDGRRSEYSWDQLRCEVAAVQSWMRDGGVQPGDHVAAWLPNTAAAVIAMLAANGLGAVFTSTSPDFGVAGVLDRFAQVEPVVLIAADGYIYGGKTHARLPLLADVVSGLPSLRLVGLVDEIGLAGPADLGGVPVSSWATVTAAAQVKAAAADGVGPVDEESAGSLIPAGPGSETGTGPASLEFRRAPIDEAGFVLYSSGTTGKPKCIVHSGAGILLKQLTEHQLHCDVRPGDRVFYFTTCGWMMWNWLVTALASGATIVLYDGSPFHPGPTAMWDLAAQESITLFGTSAKFIDACAKAGVSVLGSDGLQQLRTITSTGSPLSAEGFAYVYRQIKRDVHLASISGGTDLCGCFVIGDPTRPVHAGEIQGPALGAAVDVWDLDGRSLRERPGERGELVCTEAFPSMPVRFAADPDGSRYRAAYFERFPGVWAHGDFASWTEHAGFVIHGRSDATLNAGGVRIGTAEIYRQVEQLPEVAESLAIGQEWDSDTRIVLFVRLADPAAELDDGLAASIRQRLRTQCSPRHVPARIVAVADLPRTRSGKLAELAVSDAVHGRTVRNTSALANPESLELFRDLPQLAI